MRPAPLLEPFRATGSKVTRKFPRHDALTKAASTSREKRAEERRADTVREVSRRGDRVSGERSQDKSCSTKRVGSRPAPLLEPSRTTGSNVTRKIGDVRRPTGAAYRSRETASRGATERRVGRFREGATGYPARGGQDKSCSTKRVGSTARTPPRALPLDAQVPPPGCDAPPRRDHLGATRILSLTAEAEGYFREGSRDPSPHRAEPDGAPLPARARSPRPRAARAMHPAGVDRSGGRAVTRRTRHAHQVPPLATTSRCTTCTPG